MFTPASKPSRLARMKSAAGPWNQVAVIQPSSCQTDANPAQSPASLVRAHFSTSWRIRNSSASCSVSMPGPSVCPAPSLRPFSRGSLPR